MGICVSVLIWGKYHGNIHQWKHVGKTMMGKCGENPWDIGGENPWKQIGRC